MDIRAKQAGRFVKGFVSEGVEISVGAELYELDAEATGGSEEASSSAPSTESPAAPPSENKKTSPSHNEDEGESSAPKESESSQPSKASSGSNIEVKVPIMGESITTGMLASWLKNKGIQSTLIWFISVVIIIFFTLRGCGEGGRCGGQHRDRQGDR